MRNLRWPTIDWWRGGERSIRGGGVAEHNGGGGAIEVSPQRNGEVLSRLGVPAHLNYPSTTLGRLLDQTAERFADLPALIYEDQRWTYRELLSYTNRVAGGLAELGVRSGDHVVMTLPNCPEFMGAFFALQKLGAKVVNIGPLVGMDDLAELIRRTRPRLLIGLDLQSQMLTRAGADAGTAAEEMRWLWVSLYAYQSALKRVGYQIKLWQAHHPADRRLHTRFEQMLRTAPPMPPTVRSDPDDVAVLQLTSGTTGKLKLAMLTHRSLLANATQVSISAQMHQGQSRVLGLLPMFHVYGLTMCLTSVVYTGGCVLPFTRFSAAQMYDAICRLKPTVMCVVPAMADAFCDVVAQRGAEEVRQALRNCHVISGSAPLTPATAQRFEKLIGVPMLQGYGLTEASPVTHCNPPDDPRDNSIGVPLPDTDVRLVDLENPEHEVPLGTTGEIIISGPQLFLGYYKDELSTRQMLRTDASGRRWLHTGDVAYADPDGYHYLVDRRKAMINHAGFKVWPAKVENVIKSHPMVEDVAVAGVADAVQTERVVALVITKNGQAMDEEALRAYCREHLAKYEVPYRFDQVKELPRSPLGKLLRHRIKVVAKPDEPIDHNGYADGAPSDDGVDVGGKE